MPEGDTIFRTARPSGRALIGKPITGFRSTYPLLTRFNDDTPLAGQTVDRVEARGKWLLIHFSGGGILATHLLMNGSWHIYRHGERWQLPRVPHAHRDRERAITRRSDFACRWPRCTLRSSLERNTRIPRPNIDLLSTGVRCRGRARAPAGATTGSDRRCAARPERAGRRGQRLQVGDLLCQRTSIRFCNRNADARRSGGGDRIRAKIADAPMCSKIQAT